MSCRQGMTPQKLEFQQSPHRQISAIGIARRASDAVGDEAEWFCRSN